MKRLVFVLVAAAAISLVSSPARAHGHGHYPHGYRIGFYGGYAPAYHPYWGGAYYPRAVYYPAVPVYPAYPPPAYPRTGFSYYTPGFSFSIAN